MKKIGILMLFALLVSFINAQKLEETLLGKGCTFVEPIITGFACTSKIKQS
jgi:hypothetical protein